MPVAIRWLDHTAIAVRSIEAALPLYRDVLGGDPQELSIHPEKGFQALTLRYPHGGGIELIAPAGEDSFVQAFLDRRGEGVHHITFLVEDLKAAVEEARAAGLRIVDEDYSQPSWREAFISPRSANGTIVQLAQTDLDLEGRTRYWPADAYRIEQRAGERASGG
jgi:methylmalonyl-CoA/ethylmalonyl-CoA epimerase